MEVTSEKAVGETGYLTDKGLISSPPAEREQFRSDAVALKAMNGLPAVAAK